MATDALVKITIMVEQDHWKEVVKAIRNHPGVDTVDVEKGREHGPDAEFIWGALYSRRK